MAGNVLAVGLSDGHTFSKPGVPTIRLLAGLGVAGDAHAGVTVQHRSRVAVDPSQPNLRQVHLIQSELFAELAAKGFSIGPGDLGENITTRGLDLLGLPTGTRLRIGAACEIELTGLRNPCRQLDAFALGLMAALLERSGEGRVVRKAGVMGVVLTGGTIEARDPIRVLLPEGPHRALERV